LKECELEYRDSIPDITHNLLRFFYSGQLWSTLLRNTVRGWHVRNLIDDSTSGKLQGNVVGIWFFNLLGFIPFVGKFIRRLWGQSYWRKHYGATFSSLDYLKRSIRAKLYERIIDWHRDGRITGIRAEKFLDNLWPCLIHLPMSILPVGLHHFLTDWQYFKERLAFIMLRPIRLYFNAELRAEWLNDMVQEGKKKHILTDEDAEIILGQVKEPFIQKYLKSLAVHICTLPITQVISVMIAIIYVATHPEMPRAQSYGIGLSIIALFQVVPISPGSLVRGLYVLFLVIKEKNFKDYNIAVFLGFFKYIGYLAFPIQMTYRYPALARFMAGHWATDAVHIVPVFGDLKSRFWPVPLITMCGTALFWAANLFAYKNFDGLAGLKPIWIAVIAIPWLCGTIISYSSGGAAMWKRIVSGALCGTGIAILQVFLFTGLGWAGDMALGAILINGFWKVFVYTIISTVGVIATELSLPGNKMP